MRSSAAVKLSSGNRRSSIAAQAVKLSDAVMGTWIDKRGRGLTPAPCPLFLRVISLAPLQAASDDRDDEATVGAALRRIAGFSQIAAAGLDIGRYLASLMRIHYPIDVVKDLVCGFAVHRTPPYALSLCTTSHTTIVHHCPSLSISPRWEF